jgi:uncharacterized protein (TIGR00730 family)
MQERIMSLERNKEYFRNVNATTTKVQDEINQGLELLKEIQKPIITVLGSHKGEPGSNWYTHCYETTESLGKKGYAIMSGGGPGIMHAANSGAMAANTQSIGIKAGLIQEEAITDPIYTHEISFNFLFVRRFILAIKSQALIFYPGGYGTLNELFEYIVLIQTKMVDKVPVILVGKEFWKGMRTWLQEVHAEGYIRDSDLELIQFVDSTDEIIDIIHP